MRVFIEEISHLGLTSWDMGKQGYHFKPMNTEGKQTGLLKERIRSFQTSKPQISSSYFVP